MPLVPYTLPAASHTGGFLSRLLNRWAHLRPNVVLPGYYPLSHAYHFPARQQAARPVYALRTKTVRLPTAPFHR